MYVTHDPLLADSAVVTDELSPWQFEMHPFRPLHGSLAIAPDAERQMYARVAVHSVAIGKRPRLSRKSRLAGPRAT